MRYLFLFIVLLSQGLFASIANAYTCTPASSYTIQIPSLYYPSTGLANDKIGSVYTATPQAAITCTNTTGITSQALRFKAYAFSIGTIVAPDGSEMFWSNNGEQNGIGYTIGASASCGTGGYVMPYTSQLLDLCTNTFTGTVTPKIQFYQTTASSGITASGITRSNPGYISVYINGTVAYKIPVYYEAFSVATPPCSVSTSAVSVSMGNVDKRLFSGVGTTAGGTDFNIALNCTKAAKVSLQIDTPTTSPSKALGLVPINTGSGAATGVAIQLINNQTNAIFKVGSVVSLNNSTVGTYNISLKAQYFQVDDTITAGSANASATFTVTYQ